MEQEPKQEEKKSLEEIVEELKLSLEHFIIKYNTDLQTINKIFSTYEDELSSLKVQFHELSFKYKQLMQKLDGE